MDKRNIYYFIIASLLIICTINCAYAGTKTADTATINKRIKFALKNIYSFPGSTEKTIDSILIASRSINYTHGIFMAHNMKGNINLVSGNLDAAMADYKMAAKYIDEKNKPRNRVINLANRALLYRQQYKLDSAEQFYILAIEKADHYNFGDLKRKLLGELGIIYEFRKDYINAYKSFIETRDLSLLANDSNVLITNYISLGLLYKELDKYQLSIIQFQKAFALGSNLSPVSIMAKLFINFGEVYSDMQSYDSAIYYYKKAIKVALPFEKERIYLSSMVNIGNVFHDKDNMDSSFHYYNLAYDSPDVSDFPDIETATMVNLGSNYLKMNDYENARKYLTAGYNATIKYGLLVFKKNALKSLITLDSIQGNYKEALSNSFIYRQVTDSLDAEEASNQIAILEFDKMLALKKYDNQILMKENQIKNELISTQQRIMLIIIIALALLLISFYLVILNRQKVRKLANKLSIQNDKLKEAKINLENNQLKLESQHRVLKELNKSKDKFLSILSHDLKGPISGFNELLMTVDEQWEELCNEEKHQLIKMLKNSSDKTYILLEDLLNWGKAANGQIQPEFRNFNVREVTLDAMKLFESKRLKKNIQFNLDISEDFQINNDARLFSQIIQNFINNAIKYNHSGGTITIQAETIEGKKIICVNDTGIGIPENILPKLFNLDANFNRPGTENEKSSGMGLILCKEYANLINAEIDVKSEVNKGSSFCLLFS